MYDLQHIVSINTLSCSCSPVFIGSRWMEQTI
uniref:Uncharacterized protein n=1 Tax=Arundo donax TaxID=35708 RepID=A0A0A9BET9_ARUDO